MGTFLTAGLLINTNENPNNARNAVNYNIVIFTWGSKDTKSVALCLDTAESTAGA